MVGDPDYVIDVIVLQRGLDGTAHSQGRAHANRVGHIDALHANALHQPGQIGHLLGGDVALVGAAHRAAHGAAHGDACGQGCFHHRCKALDAFGNAAVDVFLAEGLAGRTKHHDLVGLAQQCRLQPLHVGGEHRIAHIGTALDARHDLGVVGHLRHPLGADKAGDLNLLEARLLQALHQLDLDGRRNRLFFVLQPIARAHIDDAHLGGITHATTPCVEGSAQAVFRLSSSSPSATWSPGAKSSSCTSPSAGAAMVCSIFMASITARGWPLVTLSPTCTANETTLPGMGAVRRPPSLAASPEWASTSSTLMAVWPGGVNTSSRSPWG